nr:hypothetical protein [Nocardioidaceae bacterium]
TYGDTANTPVRVTIAVVSVLIVAGAVYISKRRPTAIGDDLPPTAASTQPASPATQTEAKPDRTPAP